MLISYKKKLFFCLIAFFFLFGNSSPKTTSLSVMKIGIDPGHGGSDPGAVGWDGPGYPNEKDFNLDVGLKLRTRLQNDGATVGMTRDTDVYLSLTYRVNYINNFNPDAFISIHCNSHSDPTANGTETYWHTYGTPADEELATHVQNRLVEYLGRVDRGVKQESFYILSVSSQIPAVLPELLFISNETEFNLINTESGQQNAAVGMRLAIHDFLGSTPPQELTLIRVSGTDPVYWLQNGKLYWVTTADVINLMSSLPGWGIDQIIDYPPDVFNPDNCPQGPRFITPNADSSNGLLIRQTGDIRVYVLDNGKRRWITSQEALNWKGTDWSADVIEVTSSIISNYIPIEGDSIYAIGEGESNQTIKNSFIDAYTRNENDPYCTSPSTWKGWPGTFSLCLGFPTGLVGDANISGYSGISGKYQRFDYTDNTYGAINWTNQYGAFEFHGAIGKKYQDLGYSGDLLGFPTSDEYQWGSYRRNDFECGYIYWVPPPVDCAYVVYCTFTISGYVREADNSPISGVVMSGLPENPSTNSSGYYSGTVEYGWSETVTPSKAGYTFSPSNRAYSNVTSDQSNQNYTGTLQTFTISGYVRKADTSPISGVTINGLPGSPVTNSSGYYSATVDYGWSGTATPTKTGYTFSPSNRPYTNVTADQSNQNYTGTLQTFTISGYVRKGDTSPISGVVMSGLPGNPSTNSSGYYSGTVQYGWSGTVTPTKDNYTFSPSYRTYSNVESDQVNQNYTGEWTDVSETEEPKPYAFQLNQNYPNPFNPETIIEYTLSKDCQVQIAIYNILGQKVRTLIDQYQTKGQKKIHWDGKDDQGNELTSGIYFYRLQAGDYKETKRMALMK